MRPPRRKSSLDAAWRRKSSRMTRPLFKYIGNKYRSASRIVEVFPNSYGTYYEPFLGSGAVLGRLRPKRSVASDICKPLIDLWKAVQDSPQSLVESYTRNWEAYCKDRQAAYDRAKDRFNDKQNPHDFLFISRACYGGVIRFRRDGFLSTPLGPHKIISPAAFAARLSHWRVVVKDTHFVHGDYSEIVAAAGEDDIIYCDPPYVDSQKIIYGAQSFQLDELYRHLQAAKDRGCFIALSIDGVKKSGSRQVPVSPPDSLFAAEAFLNLGGSMLKRFWREGGDVMDEHVRDRLLLSHSVGVPMRDLFGERQELSAIV